MQNFIIKSTFVLLLFSLTVFLLNLVIDDPINFSNYNAVIIDKHNRLDSIKNPKIIFAGGSSLAFGLNSQKIEEAFSVPVVNLGLNASLGLDFIIEELKQSVQQDDIVFFNLEYLLQKKGIYQLKHEVSQYYKPARQYFKKNYYEDFKIYLENSETKIKKVFTNYDPFFYSRRENVYIRKGFNKFGDLIAHLDKPPAQSLLGLNKLTYRFWEGITTLNNFYDYARSKRINVYFIFPNCSVSFFNLNSNTIRLIERDLKKNLKFEIISLPKDLVLPDTYFYDTVYHLNKSGREKRTKKLIELIKNHKNAVKSIQNSKIASLHSPRQ